MHEPMQIAMRLNYFGTGSKHQVKGIAQDNLGTRGLDFFRRHGLDRAISTDWHEGRCLYRAPAGGQLTSAGQSVGLD